MCRRCEPRTRRAVRARPGASAGPTSPADDPSSAVDRPAAARGSSDLRACAEPDRQRRRRSSANVLRGGDETATSGEDHRPVVLEDCLQDVAFEPAVVVLAVQREELGQAQIRGLFDSTIELDERHAQAPCQTSADGRLAGAAQAEKRDDRLGILRLAAR